jgi:hypothetical protein
VSVTGKDDPGPIRAVLSPRSLREELEASGAQPNSRLSALSRYMLDHHDELHVLKVVEGYSWQAIAAVLSRQAGIAGGDGLPVTAAAAKLAWSRISRRRQKATAASAAPAAPAPGSASASRPVAAIGPGAGAAGAAGSGPLPGMAAAASPAPPEAPTPSSQLGDAPFVGPDLAMPDIRPARPRGAPAAPAPTQDAARSTLSLLSTEEVERRIADLAARQGGPKLPTPGVL